MEVRSVTKSTTTKYRGEKGGKGSRERRGERSVRGGGEGRS